MADAEVVPLVDEGLGNSAYLVDLGDGRGLVVDAALDLRAAWAATRRRGLRLAFAAETHLHADFVSGARQLAETEGTRVLASAAGRREFPHRGLRDGDEVDLGGLRLRALATPGHTHEHLAFLLLDGGAPLGVFTGGSLLVGSAARTDLVAPERTGELARLQHASLRRLAALPDEVAVWPTHGAGSFCSAPPGAERTSTIGREKATNPLLALADADAFAAELLASTGSYPAYFRHLPEVNRRGPDLLKDDPALTPLDEAAVRALLADGAMVVDARPIERFAAGHVPGALANPLRPAFASWLGWLVPADRPLVVVRDRDQDAAEIAWQAAKIGFGGIAGELAGGMAAWTGPTAAVGLVRADGVGGAAVLDVRQEREYRAGHVPGALHAELGSLGGDVPELPRGRLVVMCGHGERAMSAASLLARAGYRDVAVMTGGPGDWAGATGRDLVSES
ncbi:MBL fold metallo-hydrolase [Saccharothrix syringae]|uniref:MBL fold metallo-hydrolase n=1 Tax=Saccharothrix syringae TaxID=103733 RepID=A0A5Q0GVZ8_SACSY|nr:MBL fold metallo-hydrolase [Saccharothrix syringae]QFZ18296.1 MBL fold metallo-hydrolase [Saccharothrix syringae]